MSVELPDDRVVARETSDGVLVLWLPGQPPRKSNQRVLRRTGAGKPLITKSDKAVAWVDLVVATMPDWAKKGLGSKKGPIDVTMRFWHRDRRSDLSVELTLDALEKAGVIANDRYVFAFHARKVICKERQGVLIGIRSVNELVITAQAEQLLRRLLG